jgi:hypothetical protein
MLESTRSSSAAPATRAPVFAALGLLILWAGISAWQNPGLMGDNIEQLIWVHGLELGYYKHPPLPTWLLAVGVWVAGWHWWLSNLAALVCLGVAGWFTYRIALTLAGAQVAGVTVLLWGLQLSTSWRAHHYSHNTPLVACVAASAWCAINAVQTRRTVWWVLFGAASGLAMLSKYQAVMSLFAIALACLHVTRWRDAQVWRGLIIATVSGLIVFSPNLFWLIDTNFRPWTYAARFLAEEPEGRSDLAMALSFTVQQLRFLGMALLAALAGWLLFRNKPATTEQPPVALPRDARLWIAHLAWTAFALTLVLGVSTVKLQNQWGVQLLQFVFIPLALWLCKRAPGITWQRLLVPVVVIHALALTVSVVQARQSSMHGWDGGGDQTYPVRALAQAAVRDWQAQTHCPLRYVAGPGYEAGAIAAFSGQTMQVFESSNPVMSPWIDTADMAARGHLLVALSREALPRDARFVGTMKVTDAAKPRRAAQVYWAVIPPAAPCAPNR